MIAAAGLPIRLAQAGEFSAEALLARMSGDKKAEAGGMILILARRIGDVFTQKFADAAPILECLRGEGAQ